MIRLDDEYFTYTKGKKEIMLYYKNVEVQELNADAKLPYELNAELVLRDSMGKRHGVKGNFEECKRICFRIQRAGQPKDS